MKKIILILFLCLILTLQGMALTYTSQYPSEYSATTCKSTSDSGDAYKAWLAFDPALSLVGAYWWTSWASAGGTVTNQRLHVDLGSAKIIRRIYYENNHHSGAETDKGSQNFTFWGSNTGAGTFDDLVYANDEGWTNITTAQGTFDQHGAANEADPKYMTVTNTTAYRYYAFKFADNHGGGWVMAVRRIELQTEDGYPPSGITWNTKAISKWNNITISKWNGM